MDDLFFNDNAENNRKKRPNGEIYDQSELGNNDVYSDSVFSHSEHGGFRVTLPEDEQNYGFPDVNSRARTPSGRPVGAPGSNNTYPHGNNASRTPKGRPVGENHPSGRQGSTSVPPGRTYGSYSSEKPGTEKGYQTPTSRNKPPVEAGRTPVRPSGGSSRRPPVRKQQSAAPSSGGSSGHPKKPKKKKNKGAKIAAAIFAVTAILIAAVFAYGYSLLGKINYETDSIKQNQYISEKELYKSSDVQNILLIGSDARSEIQGMRSDTMILLSIDQKNKQLKLTSFLRDSYVCIPSTGYWRKLNAACSAGGAQLVIDTIEYNFKVKIDNYVLVDFEVFTKLIDLMGGLTVKDVTAAEAKYLREKVKIVYAKEGTNKFSGAAALWYCRIRYLDDDFHRTQRQRKVIAAIIDQAKGMNPVELIRIVEQVLPMITTDIGRNDMLKLGLSAATKYVRYDIQQHQIPAKGTWNNRRVYGVGDVLEMDIDENVKLLKEFIAKKQSSEETSSKK